jgi:transcriptional regulator with XRE-family HTH domain
VRAARLAKDLTQAELAAVLDVTVMTVSRRETGASPTPWEVWLGITHALGLPIDWTPPPPPKAASPKAE